MFGLINLLPNKYSQEFHCYPSTIKWDRCLGSCNTLNELSYKVCIPNKTEDFESKRVQHDYRNKWIENINKDLVEENVVQINGVTTVNVDVSVKKVMYVKKIMFGIFLYVIVKMENIWQVL